MFKCRILTSTINYQYSTITIYKTRQARTKRKCNKTD